MTPHSTVLEQDDIGKNRPSALRSQSFFWGDVAGMITDRGAFSPPSLDQLDRRIAELKDLGFSAIVMEDFLSCNRDFQAVPHPWITELDAATGSGGIAARIGERFHAKGMAWWIGVRCSGGVETFRSDDVVRMTSPWSASDRDGIASEGADGFWFMGDLRGCDASIGSSAALQQGQPAITIIDRSGARFDATTMRLVSCSRHKQAELGCDAISPVRFLESKGYDLTFVRDFCCLRVNAGRYFGDPGPSDSPQQGTSEEAPVSKENSIFRILTAFQYMLAGSPVTMVMEETYERLGSPQANEPISRGRLLRSEHATWIRWLNQRRSDWAPLREGELHVTPVRSESGVFGFSRRTSDEEVVLLTNMSDAKRRVEFQVQSADRMVGIWIPRALQGSGGDGKASSLYAPLLKVNGNRQTSGPAGEVKIWMEPWSVRFAVVGPAKRD